MNLLDILNSDLVLPILAFLVVVIYVVQKMRSRRKYKR